MMKILKSNEFSALFTPIVNVLRVERGTESEAEDRRTESLGSSTPRRRPWPFHPHRSRS